MSSKLYVLMKFLKAQAVKILLLGFALNVMNPIFAFSINNLLSATSPDVTRPFLSMAMVKRVSPAEKKIRDILPGLAEIKDQICIEHYRSELGVVVKAELPVNITFLYGNPNILVNKNMHWDEDTMYTSMDSGYPKQVEINSKLYQVRKIPDYFTRESNKGFMDNRILFLMTDEFLQNIDDFSLKEMFANDQIYIKGKTQVIPTYKKMREIFMGAPYEPCFYSSRLDYPNSTLFFKAILLYGIYALFFFLFLTTSAFLIMRSDLKRQMRDWSIQRAEGAPVSFLILELLLYLISVITVNFLVTVSHNPRSNYWLSNRPYLLPVIFFVLMFVPLSIMLLRNRTTKSHEAYKA